MVCGLLWRRRPAHARASGTSATRTALHTRRERLARRATRGDSCVPLELRARRRLSSRPSAPPVSASASSRTASGFAPARGDSRGMAPTRSAVDGLESVVVSSLAHFYARKDHETLLAAWQRAARSRRRPPGEPRARSRRAAGGSARGARGSRSRSRRRRPCALRRVTSTTSPGLLASLRHQRAQLAGGGLLERRSSRAWRPAFPSSAPTSRAFGTTLGAGPARVVPRAPRRRRRARRGPVASALEDRALRRGRSGPAQCGAAARALRQRADARRDRERDPRRPHAASRTSRPAGRRSPRTGGRARRAPPASGPRRRGRTGTRTRSSTFPYARDLDVARAERLLGEPARRARGVVPPLAELLVLGRRDLRDPRHGGEEHAAGSEDPVERRERGAHVVDELERLGHDRAVERVARDVRRVGEVADDRRLRDCPPSPSGCRPARRRGRSGSCSPGRRSRARGRGCPPHASRRTARRRRGRSACRARSPSSGRSASRGGGRRASADAAPPVDVGRRSGRRRRSRLRDERPQVRSVASPAKAAIIGRRGALRPGDPATVVVVSPHSTTACSRSARRWRAWARAGSGVELLTVLALDPESDAPTGGWDRRARLRDRGRGGARAPRGGPPRVRDPRRDAGLAPVRERRLRAPRDEADVRRAVVEAVDGADVVLLPGSPLSHPDHAWLVRALVQRRASPTRLGLYAEQPYTRRAAASRRRPRGSRRRSARRVRAGRRGLRDRLAKWRAIRCYRSQLPLLGMGRSLRRGPHRLAPAARPSGSPGAGTNLRRR